MRPRKSAGARPRPEACVPQRQAAGRSGRDAQQRARIRRESFTGNEIRYRCRLLYIYCTAAAGVEVNRIHGDRLEPWKGHPAAGQNPGVRRITNFARAQIFLGVRSCYRSPERFCPLWWFLFQIGRALLAPAGGGTHQESRNNGDRLEPWKGHPAAGQNPARSGVTGSGGNLLTSTALMLQRGREAARRAGSTQREKLAPARTC